MHVPQGRFRNGHEIKPELTGFEKTPQFIEIPLHWNQRIEESKMTVELKEIYHADIQQKMRNVYRSLSEKDRRRYAAAEVVKLGYGGVASIA